MYLIVQHHRLPEPRKEAAPGPMMRVILDSTGRVVERDIRQEQLSKHLPLPLGWMIVERPYE